jgi:hypothetical protein
MQNSQIKIDHWYQTKEGIGQCRKISGKVRFYFKFANPTRIAWLTGKEVEYEIPKGEEPKEGDAGDAAPAPARAPKEEIAPTTLAVLLVIKKHLDELDHAWQSGEIVRSGWRGATQLDTARASRNADLLRMLEKVIAKESKAP